MENENSDIRLGGSKTYSVADGLSLRSIKKDDTWGEFDEDWGFRVWDIPKEFRTKEKYENFLLAKKEEKEKKLILNSKPYNIVIEPTNICNLHCPLCSTGIGAETRKKGSFTYENFKKIIDQVKDSVLELWLQNWGEPTLVKELPKMINYASTKKVFTLLSSNFSVNYSDEYLEEFIKSGLGKLQISLDGTTQEIYEKYRINGNIETVFSNIKKAIKIKKENNLKYPLIQTRMIVSKYNEHQIDEFRRISRELEVDEMELGNLQLNPNTAKNWLPKNKEFVYESLIGERSKNPCSWPWSGFTINWDGGISPCCIVDDENSDFGNVFEKDLMTIWNNEYFVSARSEFSDIKKISKTTICNICKNDTHNPNLLRIGDTFSITMNPNVKTKT